MSFTAANPGTWAPGAQLTSVQINKLDADHVNSLDKSAAGDTLAGTVVVAGAAQITTGAGSTRVINTGIEALQTRSIRSTVNGGISLEGGAADWPLFGAVARTRSVAIPLIAQTLSTGWAYAGAGQVTGPGNLNFNSQAFLLPRMHNGATLSSVTCTLSVTGPHSGVPASFSGGTGPAMTVSRTPLSAGLSVASVFLSTTGTQGFTPAPGTGAAWDASHLTQQFTYTCNQNNVIDNTQYVYQVVLSDESGANSVQGNIYVGFILNYTAIADMRFA